LGSRARPACSCLDRADIVESLAASGRHQQLSHTMMRRAMLLGSALAVKASAGHMDCGEAPLCGVLVLEDGGGSGHYHHNQTVVHGIWPQVPPHGNSECIKPKDQSEPVKLASCYSQGGESDHQLEFQRHEWDAHGKCAGTKDSSDFFEAVCNLSSAPLKIMETTKEGGGDLSAMHKAVVAAGYEVFQEESSNDQLYLSACADSEGFWKLSAVKDFSKTCGGSSPPSPGPSPSPPGPSPSPPGPSPSPSVGSCSKNKRGPKCNSDADCTNLKGCVRCAKSGYCTAQPIELTEGLIFV